MSTPSTSSGESLRPYIGFGLLLLPLAAAALAAPKGAVLMLGALAGLAGLLSIAAFVPQRLGDVLYFALLATVAIPLDKYFGYQSHIGGWPGLRIALADVFAVLLALVLMIGRLLGHTRLVLPAAVGIPYLLWLVQYVFSALGAPRRELAAYEIASAVHALVIAVLVASFFERRHADVVFSVVATLVILHTGFAVVQAATGRPIGAGLFGGRGEVMKEALSSGMVRLRPSGLFDHPIVYADFILVSLPMLAAGVMILRRPFLRLIVGMGLAIGLGGLVLTLSRGAWISSLAAAALLAFLALRLGLITLATLKRVALPAAVGALVLAAAFGPKVYERVTESQKGNLRVRFELNEIALSMVKAHPFVGVGLNNFIPVMDRYDPKDVMRYFPATVHNLYLLEASEAGIPAALFLIATGAGLTLWTLRRLPQIDDRVLRWLAAALLAGLTGFALSQVADFSHRLEPLRTVLWAYVGLLIGAVRTGVAEARA